MYRLTFMKGNSSVFLGPSGCGKTTLLRVIAGLDPQTSGRVEIDGRDISRLPASARDYGIVFQSYALFPNLNVHANIAYGLRLKRKAEAERVRELLAMIGLPDIAGKYPSQLSGGQQQRVALARALAPSPGLLLLDEPLSALDARVRMHLRGHIRDLHHRLGITTIMVTHDQEEALTMADRIVVMNHGEVVQVGTPDEIYRRPATPFIADFVGSMNFLTGVVAGEGQIRLGELILNCFTTPAPGSPVTVCVRPEDVTIHHPKDPNTIDVHVETMEFLGAFHRVRLAGERLGEYRLTADFSANIVRDHRMKPGDCFPVTLPSEYLHVYPAV